LDKQLHQAYQNACASDEYNEEHFVTRHNQFGALCEAMGIKLVIFWADVIGREPEHFSSHLRFGTEHACVQRDFVQGRDLRSWFLGWQAQGHQVGDFCHFNDHGHQQIAKHIEDHIRSQNLT
jgi:lysophospholipase L1-like esterase